MHTLVSSHLLYIIGCLRAVGCRFQRSTELVDRGHLKGIV
jgi:hypothetical protein